MNQQTTKTSAEETQGHMLRLYILALLQEAKRPVRKRKADPLYDQACALRKAGRGSMSMIQRQLGIGYKQAAELVEQMKREHLVSVIRAARA